MNEEFTSEEILNKYATHLVPEIMKLLELAGAEDKLLELVKSTIWNQKDLVMLKIKRKNTEEDLPPKIQYKRTYKL